MPYLAASRGITEFLIRWRWPLLALGLTITALSFVYSRRLEFDRSVENMFAPHDPLLVPYREVKRIFGGNEIALAAYDDPKLLTPEGMERLDRLTRQMAAVDGVQGVLSLSSTKLIRNLVGKNDRLLEPLLKLLEGYAIDADRRTAAVVCLLNPEAASEARASTVNELRRLIEAHDPSGVLTGEPVMVVDGFRLVDEDGDLLGWVSTLLLMATIVFFFRSVRWVLVPLLIVWCTLWSTQALLVLGNFRLSMVSSMLWAVVTVIGVAAVTHVIVRVRLERAQGYSSVEALRRTGASLAVPMIWVCLSDTAGFGSLLATDVGPVQDFGKMMALGSILSMASIAMLLPGLALAGRIDSAPRRAWGEDRLDGGLHWIAHVVERHPRWFFVGAALVVCVSVYGTRWLTVETDFTRNFRPSSKIVQAYRFVETRLGGAGVWDVLIPAPEKLDKPFLARVGTLQERLRREVVLRGPDGATQPGLTKVLSIVDALDTLPEAARRLATVDMLLAQIKAQMPVAHDALVGRDPQNPRQRYVRIMLRAYERQPSAQKEELIAQVTRITHEEFPEAQVTGFFILLTRLIDSMIRDQWVSFLIATSAIFVMMIVALRDVKLAVIAMIPNALPVSVITGWMGWLGVPINMGAAMIAAVSMGLAVDASIHYITEYLEERERGHTPAESLKIVHQNAGRALVFSTLALIVGFSALGLSQFVPTIYFGVLMCLTMIGGMIGNLVLLPLMLKWVDRNAEKRSGEPRAEPRELASPPARS